jgi:hypothetical protein
MWICENVVYWIKNKDIQKLKARRDAVAVESHHMLQNTWTEAECYVDSCRATRDANIKIC